VKLTSETSADKQMRNILLTVLAVMIIIFIVSFGVCYHAAKAESHIRYVGMMNVASEKIAKTIRGMEMNAMNEFDEVEKHLDSPETVIAALESKTSLNPDVRGYFAAFEPNYFPQEGKWFEPYVHQPDSSGNFEVRQVGSEKHDYTKSDWYVRAKKSDESFWSDPYYYYDGTNISGHYCTFVKPIFDVSGRMACVCGADMTFEWLTKELQRIDDENKDDDLQNLYFMYEDVDCYTVVINNSDGSCIAHPEGKRVSLTKEQLASSLSQKKTGIIDLQVNGVPSTVYYTPIDNVNWSVAIVIPNQNLPKPLFILGLVLLLVTVSGMIVVWLVSRRRPS
jgi:hypothetical protein